MKLSLEDRVVVITGPAKGMGAAVTHAFAREGCKLALIGRDTDAIKPVAKEVRSHNGNAIVIACDLTDAKQCDAAAEATKEAFGGRIDVLVNIAGGSGPIVNVGGTFGMRGRAGRVAYSASKWGLRGITKSFALEVGQHNINVNCVAPGMVDGPRFREKVCRDMAQKLGISEEEAAERHAADYALKRITVDDDVANACLFFASDVSRQITGVDLPVDGGWAML